MYFKIPILFRGEEYNEEAADKLNEALTWLDSSLDGRAFVAGDNLTIADITIIVTLTNIDVSILFFCHTLVMRLVAFSFSDKVALNRDVPLL